MSHPQFDPTLIERYAEQLYRKADSVRIGSAVAGAVLGVIFGAVPISPLGAYLPVPSTFGMATILLGALVGGFIGYVIGEGRAFRVRLQAQMVLFQLQLERNTAGHAAAPVPVAAPVAAPVVAPAPAQPAPVAAAAPEPLVPVLPAASGAQPAVPAPVLAPRPALEAVPPLERSLLDAVEPQERGRPIDDLAPPLLPPLSPSAHSGS